MRIQINQPVRENDARRDSHFEEYTLDLSERGIFLRIMNPAAINTRLLLQRDLDGSSPPKQRSRIAVRQAKNRTTNNGQGLSSPGLTQGIRSISGIASCKKLRGVLSRGMRNHFCRSDLNYRSRFNCINRLSGHGREKHNRKEKISSKRPVHPARGQ